MNVPNNFGNWFNDWTTRHSIVWKARSAMTDYPPRNLPIRGPRVCRCGHEVELHNVTSDSLLQYWNVGSRCDDIFCNCKGFVMADIPLLGSGS